ncbi:MAG: hypothetical protein WA947_08210 [Phormidesmis sp.]
MFDVKKHPQFIPSSARPATALCTKGSWYNGTERIAPDQVNGSLYFDDVATAIKALELLPTELRGIGCLRFPIRLAAAKDEDAKAAAEIYPNECWKININF